MMDTITMNPVGIEGRISGSSVIDDLLGRIGEKLARHDGLRATDSYSSYNATVSISLDLVDVDTTTVATSISVGQMPAPPAAPIAPSPKAVTLVVPPVVASIVIERREPLPSDTLERQVDGNLPEPHPAVQQPSLERNADGTELEPPAPQTRKKYNPPKWATPGSSTARRPSDVVEPGDTK